MADCDKAPLPERLSATLIGWGLAISGRFGRVRRPGATAAAILLAAYGIAQILKSNNTPHESSWASGSIGLWVFIALASSSTTASLLVVLGYRALLGAQGESEALAAAARGIVRVLETSTKLTHNEFGVNVWVVQGIKGFQHLERRAIAVAQDREATPIMWTKGKGVIGRSWARSSSTFADLEELRLRTPTASAWCSLEREDRFRFSWQEFDDTERYKGVLAIPLRPRIYGRPRVRGVISIDVLAEGKGKVVDGLQRNPEISSIIRTCQAVLGRGSAQ